MYDDRCVFSTVIGKHHLPPFSRRSHGSIPRECKIARDGHLAAASLTSSRLGEESTDRVVNRGDVSQLIAAGWPGRSSLRYKGGCDELQGTLVNLYNKHYGHVWMRGQDTAEDWQLARCSPVLAAWGGMQFT